jgi:hypothetical protein
MSAKSEIRYLNLVELTQEYILWFDVPMGNFSDVVN